MIYGWSVKAISEWRTRRSKLVSKAAASGATTAASRSGPAKLRMESRERQVVSTTISTSSSERRSETLAPRYPGTRRSSGRTLLEKCSRYLGNCASVARADQRRKIVPVARAWAEETADEGGGSLPTTTFQGRSSHFLARPLMT